MLISDGAGSKKPSRFLKKEKEPLLEQIQNDYRPLPKKVIYDRGGRVIKDALGAKVTTTGKSKASDSEAKSGGCADDFEKQTLNQSSDTEKPIIQ